MVDERKEQGRVYVVMCPCERLKYVPLPDAEVGHPGQLCQERNEKAAGASRRGLQAPISESQIGHFGDALKTSLGSLSI